MAGLLAASRQRRGAAIVATAAMTVTSLGLAACSSTRDRAPAVTATSVSAAAAAPSAPAARSGPSVLSVPPTTLTSATASATVAPTRTSTPTPIVLPPRPPETPVGPVVVVHGYGGDTSMLDSLVARLKRAGRHTILLALPDNAQGDLNAQAQVLGAQVARELAAGARSVDLVGYSAGGLVVALFVAQHPSQVRRVVTLGSPLHGTAIAALAAGLAPSACPTACQQMVPGSAILNAVGAASPTRTGVPWLSLWTSHDEVVQPPSSARFAGADNIEIQTVCADDTSDHLRLPQDPLAEGLTLHALGALPLPTPTAADCAPLRAFGG